VWDGHGPVDSTAYEPTRDFLERVEPAATPLPAHARTCRVVGLPSARRHLRSWMDTRLVVSRGDEALLAVYELVVNSLRAAGEAWVDEWVEDDMVVWQVRDSGPGLDDVTAGYVPPPRDPSSGRGLWLARSLADDSSLRSQPGRGTTARLLFRVDAAR
jgi:anti-sigma regulatory factor (Ser/Thr protein kinase)